jgi:cellulose biosynthesis protein BcsQ
MEDDSATEMRAQIIVTANFKGGVGKTTVSFGLIAAAVSRGNRVIALDTDPTGGLSVTLARRVPAGVAAGGGQDRPPTAYDVLQGQVSLQDALFEHPLGAVPGAHSLLRTLSSDVRLFKAPITVGQLQNALGPVLDEADYVIVDTQPHGPSLSGPAALADHIVIPTMLDLPSLRSTALTVIFLDKLELLSRVRGLVVTNMRRPAARIAMSFYQGLQYTGLPFDTVLYNSEAWVRATSGAGHLPDAQVLAEAQKLFAEVLSREAPMAGFEKLLKMARGRGPAG